MSLSSTFAGDGASSSPSGEATPVISPAPSYKQILLKSHGVLPIAPPELAFPNSVRSIIWIVKNSTHKKSCARSEEDCFAYIAHAERVN